MNIFIINSGSSSIKYQLFKMPSTEPVCSGIVERIGSDDAVLTHKIIANGEENKLTFRLGRADHEAGLNKVNELLTDPEIGVIRNRNDISAVGHRVVHGGERFSQPTRIAEDVKNELRKLFLLAPLHNPAGYTGIEVAEKIFPDAEQIAVFDTAFHHTLPPKAFRFAIPDQYYKENNIRVYGFHGTSHKFIAQQAAAYLGRDDLKLISVHLGNGCSITAIDKGRSVDTSMGFGPLSGLIMGTRSGDIDPTVIFYLIDQFGYTPEQVNNLLNKNSGMLGLTGSNDMRDIRKAMAEGNANAKLAYEMYAYRIKKYIGAYAAALNGVDVVAFTAGVGENDVFVREMVCKDMEYLGIEFDPDRNNMRSGGIQEISREGSTVKVLIIPTNEELEIANQCYGLLSK
ncbi:MAG: acetate kinase [Bacteroidetes bacterium]|nr:acetate kinase [Bacteroidota bacterium]